MSPPKRTISDLFLRRPVLSLVLTALLLLLGALSLVQLQVENLPPIAPGRVSVSSTYPGGSPEVVEQGVTALLEQQLNGLERLDTIRSTSVIGRCRCQVASAAITAWCQRSSQMPVGPPSRIGSTHTHQWERIGQPAGVGLS